MLRRAVPCWLEDADNGLAARFHRLLNGLWDDLRARDERVSQRPSVCSSCVVLAR